MSLSGSLPADAASAKDAEPISAAERELAEKLEAADPLAKAETPDK